MSQTKLSVQLYSVAEAIAQDAEGTLTRLAQMGLRNVEGVGITENPKQLRATLAALDLRMPTAHAPFLSDELRFGEHVMEVPAFEQSLEAAALLGVELLIDPMVTPERWATQQGVDELADRMNERARVAAEHGLRVGYHNHSLEFHHRFEEKYALEYFAEQLDEGIALQVDVFWAAIGGADVPALLERLGDRVRALHVKDGLLGADPMRPEHLGDMSLLDQRAAGQGELDFPAVLAAAPFAEYAVIEFDVYPGDIFEGIESSVRFFNESGLQ